MNQNMLQANLRVLIAVISCGCLLPTTLFAQDDLAGKVQQILGRNCGACHRDSDDGGMSYITDLARLVERKKVTAKNLEKSRIWMRINDADDPMPPEGAAPRPTAEEKETIKQWIMSLGDSPEELVIEERPEENPAREKVPNSQVITVMHDYLAAMDESDRKFQRFVVLNHLHNRPREQTSASMLNLVRAAVSKTFNSLTWSSAIVLPRIVDADKTVLAIDLRDLEWDENRSTGRPDMWNLIVETYPYSLKFDQYPDVPNSQRKAREIYEWTGISIPAVRADWLVATATQPRLYHTLVYDAVFPEMRNREARQVNHHDGTKGVEQPMSSDDLFRWLNVDVKGNIVRGRAVRAGFTKSGVSSQPRLIERHPASYGMLWDSYDFKRGNETMNVNGRPLGPEGIFDASRFGKFSFRHDGGEMIFGLPNGLHAYLLVDGKGNRIPFGPPDVVEDRSKTLGNSIIVNGLSCIACHKQGLIEDFADEVRFGVKGLPAEARRVVRKMYLDRPEFNPLIERDQQRYRQAAIEAMAPFVSASDLRAMEKGGPLVEPVGPVAKEFLVTRIDLAMMAAELEVEPDTLKTAIEFNESLQRLGVSSVTEGGTINREIWQNGEGLTTYQKAAQILKVGTPTSFQAPPWRR